MRIDLLTLFPSIAEGPLGASMIGRARAAGRVDVRIHNLREWAEGKHRVTDDMPFGGGQGMVLKPEPVFAAVEALRTPGARVILPSPAGRVFRQADARRLAGETHLIFVCGHYEGVDHRVVEGGLVNEELSIGDYVLTNGALAACVMADAVVRLLPGVLGDELSALDDSFSERSDGRRILEAPHYTRPGVFRGMRVPDVLLGGNHAAIARWRAEQAEMRTRACRPDLLGGAPPQPAP